VSVFASRAENTCSALLCEELRKLGLEAYFEEHFLTEFGTSKPDIYARWKNANYFIEAKQKPRKLVDAVSKAYTYQKRLQAVGPKAVFAVLYPPDCLSACEMAVLLNQPPFYVYQSTASLQELAQRIYSMITEPPPLVELNTTDAIKLLREAVSGISEAFAKIQATDVEEIFGGHVFFETILGVSEEKEIPIEHLRAAASYLLVNQILFYQILAKEKKELIRYKEIDSEKLEDTKELQAKYFSRVLLEDYKPVFGFDVASKINGSKALEAVRVAIDAVNALSPESLGHDVLGKIFHNLIPLELRKVIAAFYTNIQAGEILASLSIEKHDALVIDPACGSGTLLVSSYQRKKNLLEQDGKKFSFRDHKRFIEDEITGIDIMPFAAHLAAIHLSLQAPLYTTDFVRIAIQDATALKPEMAISPAQEVLKDAFKQRRLTEDYLKPVGSPKEKVKVGIVELSDQANSKPIQLDKTDIVIMNPPFTRFQRTSPTYKLKLSERFPESRYQRCIHGQLGLHGYFLLLADRFLKKDGKLAAVLPVTTLSAKGFYDIQDIWFNDYSIEHLIVCEGRSAFSENVLTREILLVARKSKPKDNKVAISVLKVSPDTLSVSEARSLAGTLKELRDTRQVGTVESGKYLFRLLPQDELAKSRRSLFRAISMYRKDIVELADSIQNLFEKSGKVITFGEYLDATNGAIHESPRGIKRLGYYGLSVVSNENRALKKHDFWYVKERTKRRLKVENRFSHLTFDIPLACLSPNIRRYAGLKSFNITDETDYVVVKPFDELNEFLKASDIETAERREALRKIKNGEWKTFVEDHSSKLALFYRADITGVGTHNLAFYSDSEMFSGGSLWTVELKDDTQNKLLCLWFNSTLNLFQVLTERKETRGGWIWLDDYVLREFSMPNLTKLSKEEESTLLQTFSLYGKTEMPSLLEQLETKSITRREIDREFLLLFGMPDAQVDTFLDRLYSILTQEIAVLKEVMTEGREPEEE
jgi:type I restriction-modification system DNA methylase subunit